MKKQSLLPVLAAPLLTDAWLQKAEAFARNLPQSQGARREGKNIILSYIVDDNKPADQVSYAEEHVDAQAVTAFRQIFEGEDEADLLMKDVRLTFIVLFWDGKCIADIEFPYFINDLIFLNNQLLTIH